MAKVHMDRNTLISLKQYKKDNETWDDFLNRLLNYHEKYDKLIQREIKKQLLEIKKQDIYI